MPEQIPVRLPDGVRLHVEAVGPADAPMTVILLHGWNLDASTWYRQVSALGDNLGEQVRIITYDARGHGRSTATPLRSATLAQLGDDLAEVLAQAAPTGPLVLVGHSLGGMAIMEYAHRHPAAFRARAAGLVLVATTAEGHRHTGYGLPPQLAQVLRVAELTGAHVLARCGTYRPPRAVVSALRPVLRWLLFGTVCDPADLRLTSSAIARAPLCSVGGFRPSVAAQQRLATLAALTGLPVAALVGDRDRLTPPRCAESIADALPTAEVTVCPDAGHMLMLERPEEVNTALIRTTRRALRDVDQQRRDAGQRRGSSGPRESEITAGDRDNSTCP